MADSDSRRGSAYHGEEILRWVAEVHAPHDAVLQAAYDAPARCGLPQIHLGPSEGKFLELLLRMVRAQRVVEVGALAGYSAIRIARALPPGGRLWTVESDPACVEVTRRNLLAGGYSDFVGILQGEALKVLPSLERLGPFDAVFLDADKENYRAYAAWAARNVRPGGLIVADNAFYFGRLLEDDSGALAVRSFHEEVREAFDTVVVPTPDGMLVGIRKG